MGRGGFSKWLGLGLLLCACARSPEDLATPVPSSQEDTTPTPSESEGPFVSDAGTDAGTAPSSPIPSTPEAIPDAGVADAGPIVTGPPAPGTPPGACGQLERTFLAESPTTGYLYDASAQGRTLLFDEANGSRRIHDTVSGHDTFTTDTIYGFVGDGSRVIILSSAFLELDVATGTVHEPIEGATITDDWEGLVLLGTSDGRRWLYTQDTGGLLPLVSTPQAHPRVDLSADRKWVLSLDAGSAVLWEVATGKHWSTPPAEDALLLPDSSGVVYVDAQERVWGWTPSGTPVLLGHQSLATPRHGFLLSSQSPVTGEAVFVNSEDVATLWSPRTGRVRVLGSDVASGVLSASGTRLILIRHPPGQDVSISAQALPAGPEVPLWHGSHFEALNLDRSGSRLAFLVPSTPPGVDPDIQGWAMRLWDVEAGSEMIMDPPAWSSSEYSSTLSVSFREDFDLIHVSDWSHSDSMYSMRTGKLLFSTVHGTTSGEESNHEWGPDGVFYAKYNRYLGPPAVELYAWDPRTGIESDIASAAISLCYSGARLVLASGMDYEGDPSHGVLRVWDPVTRTSETLATDVNFATCNPKRSQVVYYTGWRGDSWDGDTYLPERGTLNVVDPARGCHQQLATNVDWSINLGDSVVYRAEGKAWRVSLP